MAVAIFFLIVLSATLIVIVVMFRRRRRKKESKIDVYVAPVTAEKHPWSVNNARIMHIYLIYVDSTHNTMKQIELQVKFMMFGAWSLGFVYPPIYTEYVISDSWYKWNDWVSECCLMSQSVIWIIQNVNWKKSVSNICRNSLYRT